MEQNKISTLASYVWRGFTSNNQRQETNSTDGEAVPSADIELGNLSELNAGLGIHGHNNGARIQNVLVHSSSMVSPAASPPRPVNRSGENNAEQSTERSLNLQQRLSLFRDAYRIARIDSAHHGIDRHLETMTNRVTHITAFSTLVICTVIVPMGFGVYDQADTPAQTITLSGKKIVVGVLSTFAASFLLTTYWLHGGKIKETIRGIKNYMNNPNELATRMERELQRGARSSYPTYAYEAGPVADAKQIEWNIKLALIGRTVQREPEVKAEIEAILAQDEVGHYNKGRLRTMMSADMSVITRCWNYISLGVTPHLSSDENKAGFLSYLSQSQGCSHGRRGQIFIYFQGVDQQVAKVKSTYKLRRSPRSGSDHRLEMVSQITTALTFEQRRKSLSLDASDNEAKKAMGAALF